MSEGTMHYPWIRHYPAGVDWFQRIDPRPLHKVLDDAVSNYGDRPCTTFFGRTSTYREIGARVDRAAAALQAIGVGPGTKVGILMPNAPSYIVYYYAILKAGGIVVNYNPLYTVEELAFQVTDSETELMVTFDLKQLTGKVEALIANGTLGRAIVLSFPGELPASKSALFRIFKSSELARLDRSAQADKLLKESVVLAKAGPIREIPVDPLQTVAVLQYTGGTTGTPKGAMLSHANLSINTAQVMAWAPELHRGKERVLGVLPFFHVFAMTVVMNFGIAMGAEIVMVPRFQLDEALKLIHERRPTIMPGVPTIFNAIQNHPKLKTFDLTCLKFCLSGGAPLPLEVKQRFETLTGCSLVEGYGLSEASPVVTCNPLSGPPRRGSIGLPLPGTIVSLRSLADPAIEVPQGERGELCVNGPQVMLGYWKRREETENQFTGKFLRTGDVAIMDPDGFFEIVDRIKDLIICSGYNVYPRRIEEAIYTHPAVEEVTVVGIPDNYRGEAPKAFVKLRAGMATTTDEIMRHLEPKLSRIELPAAIEIRDSLPKTMIGKLSKKELRAEAKLPG
ncbi:MAG: long-chain fatty acid--CoA ligase [Hyphomicrobium sp.]|nr:long-chain fatty acid--CoA ligase [Hyphomicrobium sp.]